MDLADGKCVDIFSENAKSGNDSDEAASSIIVELGGVNNVDECCSLCAQRAACVAFSFQETKADVLLLQSESKSCVLLSSIKYDFLDDSSCTIGTYPRWPCQSALSQSKRGAPLWMAPSI